MTRACLLCFYSFIAVSTLAEPCTFPLTVPARLENKEGLSLQIGGPPAAEYIAVVRFDDEHIPPITVATKRLVSEGELYIGAVPRTTRPLNATVVVFALSASATCRAEASFTIDALPDLSYVAGRAVVPIAGSAPGAFGSQWKTSLLLRGIGRGTIYFRREGTFFGDARDPHMRYELGDWIDEGLLGVAYWEDIMAALGVSGAIGNLDIVPDPHPDGLPKLPGMGLAPAVTARVYNESACGPLGTDVPVLGPEQLVPSAFGFPLPPPMLQRARVNVGIRTFDVAVNVDVYTIMWSTGGLSKSRSFIMPPHTFDQMTLNALMGRDVNDEDESLLLFFLNGPVAVYRSVTDNISNDPRVYVDSEHPRDVDMPVVKR